MILLYHF
ncbi:hypothetical protein B4U79_13279 [Dinothrombium tinctorium]|nr:hypothetical protein B4U79_13279 [Dinothrombium tinctorium]